jgi:two-component system response regulator RegA
MKALRLLVVDDDRVFRETLAGAFRRRGYTVQAVAAVDEGLAALATFRPERVIVDLKLEDKSGLDFLRRVQAGDDRPQVVMLTGYGSIPTAIEAMKLGAVHYMTKPAEPAEIEAAFAGMVAAPLGTPSLERTEWEHIQRVLGDHDGNISAAARALGMHRRTLQRKLQKNPRSG